MPTVKMPKAYAAGYIKQRRHSIYTIIMPTYWHWLSEQAVDTMQMNDIAWFLNTEIFGYIVHLIFTMSQIDINHFYFFGMR